MKLGVFRAETVVLSLACASSMVLAQNGPGPGRSASGMFDQRFEEAAPAIGEPMPDLTVYDAEGEALRLRELLRDHYTVLVLGCLT